MKVYIYAGVLTRMHSVDGFGQQQAYGLDKEEHVKRQWLKTMFTETLSNAMMASDDELEKRSKEVTTINPISYGGF